MTTAPEQDVVDLLTADHREFDRIFQELERLAGQTGEDALKRKRELVDELKPYETGERGMGDPSRWAGERELEWIELRPELVVEVTFDHTSNDRIRHGTKLVRWRDDKAPADCRTDQLAQ